jgi:hypothetical protein
LTLGGSLIGKRKRNHHEDRFAAAGILMMLGSPVFALGKYDPGKFTPPGSNRAAPGPLMGAGLPVLAMGYGIYWLIRRRRKPD